MINYVAGVIVLNYAYEHAKNSIKDRIISYTFYIIKYPFVYIYDSILSK